MVFFDNDGEENVKITLPMNPDSPIPLFIYLCAVTSARNTVVAVDYGAHEPIALPCANTAPITDSHADITAQIKMNMILLIRIDRIQQILRLSLIHTLTSLRR